MNSSLGHWLLQRRAVRTLARRFVERMQPLAREVLSAPRQRRRQADSPIRR